MIITLREITTIYTSHVDTIYKFFYYRTLSRSLAEDLTSDTFLQFTTAVAKKKDIQDPTRYLYGIAKHIFIHFLQNKYQEKDTLIHVADIEQVAFDEYVNDSIETMESTPTPEERITPYINQLPDKQREIVIMRVLEKLTPKEIAIRIGKDINYVKTTQKRGFRKLRALISCTPPSTNNM